MYAGSVNYQVHSLSSDERTWKKKLLLQHKVFAGSLLF